MWLFSLKLKDMLALISMLIVAGAAVDLWSFSNGLVGGGSYFAGSAACAIYFAGVGAIIRFIIFRKPITSAFAVLSTGFALFGWSLLLVIMGTQIQASFFMVLSLALCFRLQLTATGKRQPTHDQSNLPPTQSEKMKPLPNETDYAHHPEVKARLAVLVVACGLFGIAALTTFPHFIERAISKSNGHTFDVIDCGRSFTFTPPTPMNDPQSALLKVISINWERLVAEVGAVVAWTAVAALFVGFRQTRPEL